ncbi:MAG: TetR/AcrR family transcriptional regulator [Alphaproteobacteria bacterium]
MPAKPAATAKRRTAEKRDRRRREVIAAAEAVFAEKGFHEATTREIGERIGLLPGSLYYYVPSKEAALAEVCRKQGAEFNARLTAVLESERPIVAKIRAGMMLHIMHNRSYLAATFTFARRDLPEAVLPALKALAEEYHRLWDEMFRRAAARGELPAGFDVQAATIGLLALCNGSLHWYEGKPASEVEAIALRLVNQFLKGVLSA